MFDRIKDGLWWDRALTLVEGCTPVSPGCDHCWSAAMAHRFNACDDDGFVLTWRGNFNGKIICREDRLALPLKTKKPTAWAVWNDLFHEYVPGDFHNAFFLMAEECSHHIFIVLTKRPERIIAMPGYMDRPWPENVWLGVTAENQEQADKRIPILLKIPAAVHFVSCEPLIGPLNIRPGLPREPKLSLSIGTQNSKSLDWVICGGESGQHARPMHPEWARSLRYQCQAAGVPFFHKQNGEWLPELFLSEDQKNAFWQKQNPQWGTLDREGNWWRETTPWNGRQGEDSPEGEYVMYRTGKKAAGRLLDGQEYLQLPKMV